MNWEINFLNEIGKIHNSILNPIMKIMSYLGSGGIVFIILGAVFLLNKKQRKMGITILIALALCGVFGNLLIKPMVGRIRPYIRYNIPIIVPPPMGASFPSGHTYSAFATAMSSWYYNRKLSAFLFGFAVLMGFSRMYLYVHYPTDVLAGALLGAVLAAVSYKIVNKLYKKKS